MEEILVAITASLNRVIQHDGCALIAFDASTRQYRCHMLRSDGEHITQSGSADEYLTCPKHNTLTAREASVLNEADMKAMAVESEFVARLVSKGVKSFCSVPFFSHDRLLGSLNVGRLRD